MSYFWNTVTSHGSFELLTLLALAAAKATLLLTFAALLCFAFRRFSAATRHLVWASALCASLLLPFLSFMKIWEVPVLPARMLALDAPGSQDLYGKVEAHETAPEGVTADSRRMPDDSTLSSRAGAEARRVSEFRAGANETQELLPATNPSTAQAQPGNETTSRATPLLLPQLLKFALAVWLAGLLLVLCKLLAGFIATRLLTRRAVEFNEPALTALFSSLLDEINLKSKVRLLRSQRTSMPVVCGILRPAVMLPAEADVWSEERRRMVLLHELTHVTRRDCLTQMMAQMACAFYWFNPFIWFAARRLRVEREQACDDYVLSIGTKPSDYASHLLDIARTAHERPVFDWSQTTSVAMARRSQLEGRLLAILSKENKRGAVSRVALTGLLALTCVLLLSLAAVHPTVIHAQDSLNSDAAQKVEKDGAGRDAPGAFVAGGAGRGIDTSVQSGSARAAGVEPEDAPAANDKPLEPISNTGRIEQEAGLTSKDEIEREAEPDGAEAPAEQIAPVQLPAVESAVSREANSFIKASHGQDGNAQAQGRPGDFIDEMAALGFTNLSVDELIRLKTSGVTSAYVRSLRAIGFANLTAKELVSMSVHGVTAAYIQTMRSAGYNALSAKELTTFRIHGITPDYIKNLRDAGYGNLDAKELLRFSVHNVTPAFIGGIRAAGYNNLTPKELVSLRVYNVTPEFIRKARGRLGELTIKQIISLKSMGILDEDKGKEKDKVKG